MSRNLVLTALLFALTGCQSVGEMSRSTAEYIKAARNKPTPMELYFEYLRNPSKSLGTFDFSRDDSQSKACLGVSYGSAVTPEMWKIVKEGSDTGNATCRHVLGTFYESGNGVAQNIGMARNLYIEAAKNDSYAYVELGRMKRDGIGEPTDPVKARDYFRLAGRAGVVALGGMMEQGQGGANDSHGALKLYIETTQKYGDAAWQAMQPLLSRGLELDAEQVQKYNSLWTEHLVRQQRYLLLRSNVFTHIKGSRQILTVTVLHQFKAGQRYPKTYLAKSCGDPVVDSLVVSALRSLRMDDPFLVPAGKDIPPMKAPLVLTPSAD